MDFIEQKINPDKTRHNIDIIIDIHWFFIHSLRHKQEYNIKKHIGKWKFFASSNADLYKTIYEMLPLVAAGKLPVFKFTNLGNVFSGEKTIVAYCFPFGPSPSECKSILRPILGQDPIWGSKFFKEP